MKNQKEQNEELFRKYLDGELSEAEEQQALHMIADDPEMREMLRFEQTLGYSFPEEPGAESFSVPENFTDSVMSRIESAAGTVPERKKEPAKIFSLLSARKLTMNPVFAAAAVILLSVGFGFLFSLSFNQQAVIVDDYGTSTQLIAEEESMIWIRFVYFDEDAESMEVAGDFSDWEPVALSREFAGGKQVWTGMVPVQRGEHRYMFVRDGEEWVTDPLAEVQQDDGFGNKNAVLYL
jgi:hypothetical protein